MTQCFCQQGQAEAKADERRRPEGLDRACEVCQRRGTVEQRLCTARQQGQPGGRVEMDRTINASNVMLLCSKCNRPVRVKHKTLADGTKVRYCKWCNEPIDN